MIHAFAYEIAVAIGIQAVAPPDARAGRLADDFRLVEEGQRQHPARVFECHEPSASRLAAGQRGHLVDEFGPCVGDCEGHPARQGDPGLPEECVGFAEFRAPLGEARPQRPGPSARPRARRLGHRSRRKVGRLRSGGHEHEILRRDRDRGHATAPCIVEPVDGHAAGRRREIDVLHEGAGEEVHAARAQPRD